MTAGAALGGSALFNRRITEPQLVSILPEEDKIIDLRGRRCPLGGTHDPFIRGYGAAIQDSERDLGKRPGMQNVRHKVLKLVLWLLADWVLKEAPHSQNLFC